IMQPGLDYLNRGDAESLRPEGRRQERGPIEKTKAALPDDGEPMDEGDEAGDLGGSGVRRPSATRRRSPTDLVRELLNSGFFDEPKTINDIIQYLADKKAVQYKSTDISPLLTRMIRNGEI